MQLLAAKQYAERGWRVFPVLSGDKRPATQNGCLDGTTDTQQIDRWWENANYNIGVATGRDSGIFVVDVDPRNGGQWHSPVDTLAAATGGGGCHYYFRWPMGVAKLRPRLAPGVDVQGEGKYVVVPPSKTTGDYRWLNDSPVAEAPPELLAAVAVLESPSDRPGDRFNAENTWADVLTPYGWVVDHEDGVVTYWTRPGKAEGVSATTNYENSDLLYVFTTSTPLEEGRGYNRFSVYTILEFGGDFDAAARSLADGGPRLRGGISGTTSIGVPQERHIDFHPATAPDHLISRFITYGSSTTDASLEYHEAAALAILGTITANMQIALAPYPDGLRTNMFILLAGASSVARKSTVQQLVTHMLADIRPNALLPDRMTGEAAINELSTRQVALWMPDEFGVMLQQIYERDFLRPLEELMLTLYGGQTYRYTTVAGGTRTVAGVHLGVFAASTPESLAGAGSRTISSGLLPRFAVVYPEVYPAPRPPVALTEQMQREYAELVHRFKQVLMLCSQPGGSRNVTFRTEALASLADLDTALGSVPITARLVTAAYKVAAIIALADLRTDVIQSDAEAAKVIVNRWARGATRLKAYIGRPASDVAFMELVDFTWRELKSLSLEANPVPAHRIARALNVERRTLDRIRGTLEARGDISVYRENGESWYVN